MSTRITRATLLVVATAASVIAVVRAWHRADEPSLPAEGRRATDIPRLVAAPIVRGRPEACLVCHAGIVGLDASHRPEAIGCSACHLGDPAARDARLAHTGLVRVPGNLVDAPRTCGQATCHASVIPRIERSIMRTMAGVIAVDRRVFGEAEAPAGPPHAETLGHGAADTHLRQLCASCHLGQPKTAWGPIDEEARGGGCSACHLQYDSVTARLVASYQATREQYRTAIPRRHPSFTVAVANSFCFGCHSRSGRLSTSYEGWMEMKDPPSTDALAADATRATPQYRRLLDGRYFSRVSADVHQVRGLACIDCHTAAEVMGTGAVVSRAREQVQIRCEDCHAVRRASLPPQHADAESDALARLRGWTLRPGQRLGVASSGVVLYNVAVNPDGVAQMRRKLSGDWAPLRPPRPSCTQGAGHARLSCGACHTAWAPRCASCHTAFVANAEAYDLADRQDVRGAWQETPGPYEATPPTLGIRAEARDTAHPRGVVDTFVPGMIMTLDRNRTPTGRADPVFRRLYARTSAHTTSRTARACQSCHNDPVALGFGQGELRYTIAGGVGRWTYRPAHAPSPQDGLPGDAWTGFLQYRSGFVSTRDDVRPFTVAEQRRILTVGACLTCHAGNSAVMQRAIVDFAAVSARKTKRCVAPEY